MIKNGRPRILIAMAPSGISWQALYERLTSCDSEVCLVHGQAVRNDCQTMQDSTSQTDAKDAARVFDFLCQGTGLLPVDRDLALRAAYRLRWRHMALKKRVNHLQHHLRATMTVL